MVIVYLAYFVFREMRNYFKYNIFSTKKTIMTPLMLPFFQRARKAKVDFYQ